MTTINGSAKSHEPAVLTTRYYEDDIVISGIAGRFPESDNMHQFRDNLMNKGDLVTDDDRRWPVSPDIPHRTGKINNLEKFDALFFGVNAKQAHAMDPMCRMLLEHTFEAIVDAGINPRQLRGANTGVFIGCSITETEKTWFYDKLQSNGLCITGCNRAMFSNRISYWLGVSGPSYTIDSACSSFLLAMEQGFRAIRSGQCDSAIIGSANLCLHPLISLNFAQLGPLSADGFCRSFDDDGNGYTRSEAAGVIYLQKAKDAKRIYATYTYGKTNCDGYKEQGFTFPSGKMQSALLRQFYKECGIPPSIVSYVEAHGTGTKVGDPEELNSIANIFCPGRSTPLQVGSVKSNMGHAEAASGVCSVAKVVIAMETELIPPNIHYKRPNKDIKALVDGRIKVITDVTPWEGGYIGVSSFGMGGANAHVLLKSNTKEKVNGGAPNDDLPRLVVISGRTEEAVDAILRDVESRPIDVEYVRLLQDIHRDEIPGHMYRGYTILGGSATKENPLREIKNFTGVKRPIWYVFSGMGSQWPGMGSALLRFPVFAAAIKKCDAVLRPRNVDIYDILTNKSNSTFDNVLNSVVGIAAVQIGLVDLLTYVGIEPDNIIGHSVGELGCAYADGCFTAEQVILTAYFRGIALIEAKTIRGSMAAIGLGYADIQDLCPPDIEIACHNGPDSSTVSGPAESVTAFVAKIQARKVFAREVNSSNIAYHSRHIAKAGPILMAYLQKVIPEPKARSPKWLSTSVPRSEWNTTVAQVSSAQYHTNNLLSPVLFEETSSLIPSDAVTIEIAPHNLLQAILRRSLNPGVTNIGLSQRGHKDNVTVFLQGLGKVFNIGLQPEISKLYPEVEFPVSRGTPMISPLIKWEHSDDWFVAWFREEKKVTSGERTVEVSRSIEEYKYVGGHMIDGRNLFPATGYLCLVWETVGMMRGKQYTEVSVVFEDVKFLRACTLPKEGTVELTIMVHKGMGRFEVVEGGSVLVTGIIRYTETPSEETIDLPAPNDYDVIEEMSSKDFYTELKLRGYQYSGLFRGVKSSAINGSKGTIAWMNNWVTFMDNMLQMHILATDTRELLLPTAIQKLTIDTKTHLSSIRTTASEEKEFTARNYKEYDVIVSGGVEIRGLTATVISRRKPILEPVLETYKFVAHRDGMDTSLQEFVRLSTGIIAENYLGMTIKSVEAIDDGIDTSFEDLASRYLLDAVQDIPLIEADVNIVGSSHLFGEYELPGNVTFNELRNVTAEFALLVCGRELFTKSKMLTLHQLLLALKSGGFLLTRETGNIDSIYALASRRDLDVILEKRLKNESILLFRKRNKASKDITIINVASNNFEWLPKLRSAMKVELENDAGGKIVLVSDKKFENGLMGLINSLRREPGGEIVRGFLIQDKNAQDFSKDNPFYAAQLQLDLALNVLRKNGVWGTYRLLNFPNLSKKPVIHACVDQLVRGDLHSLQWIEGPLIPTQGNRKLARVFYASINFHDIMTATGKLGVTNEFHHIRDCPFGLEYSGVDHSGRRIMGVVEARGLSNLVLIDEKLIWQIPDSWSFEDAATIPLVYATCYYALYLKAKMNKNDVVLIHAGAGGVGQAAITLALHEGCEVFTTVGTPEKRRFIRERFPQIDVNHIGNTRDTSFEQMITRQTKGRGVDIVLNSLAEEKLQASVRCLAAGGRFLEIGKFDLTANNALGMKPFLKEISFVGVMLDNLIAAPPDDKVELQQLMQAGLDSGAVKPLSRTVFPREEVEAAFRYMAAGKHIGKVIISIHDKTQVLHSPGYAFPRFYCLGNRSYVVHGGLGGFGMELANWLVVRGARNLVLTSRSGITNGYQKMRMELWKRHGVNVLIVSGKDASKHHDCEDILKTASKLAPVDGIFNLAVVLNDALMENQTEASFEVVLRSKAWSTKQLDDVSRKVCPLLRHFVVFSSGVSNRGNAGQTNYGMANSVIERICEKRVDEGYPGLAVQWGSVKDIGIVAEMQEAVAEEIIIIGVLQQDVSSCLEQLDKFLKHSEPIVACEVLAEKHVDTSLNVVDTVLNIMSLKDLKSVSLQTSLTELGMDSMMAVEIKQAFEREFGIFLTSKDIRALNFAQLVKMTEKEAGEKKDSGKKVIGGDILTGMKLFVHIFGEKELPEQVCLKLATKEESDRNEVFLIPGILGQGNVFENLASKLRSSATCLQLLSNDNGEDSITDMAQQFLPHVLEKNKNRRDFVIAGYSFGALVAIELARKLEAEGFTGRLVLIDGSPELVKSLKEQQISTSTDAELERNLLISIMDRCSPATSSELVVALDKCKTWKEKLDAFMALAATDMPGVASDKLRSLCTAMLKRFIAVQNYDHIGLPPLRSSIILLKPSSPTVTSISLDYGLSMVTSDKVEMYTIDGDHMTILDNVKVAAAIDGEPLEDAAAFYGTI